MKQAIPTTCRRLREWLPPYAEGKLRGALATAVARHLVTCARCQQEVADLRAVLNTLHSVPAARMPEDLVASVGRAVARRARQGGLLRPSWSRLAIPTAVVTGALAVLLTLSRPFSHEGSLRMSPVPAAHLGEGESGAELSRAAKAKVARAPVTAPAAGEQTATAPAGATPPEQPRARKGDGLLYDRGAGEMGMDRTSGKEGEGGGPVRHMGGASLRYLEPAPAAKPSPAPAGRVGGGGGGLGGTVHDDYQPMRRPAALHGEAALGGLPAPGRPAGREPAGPSAPGVVAGAPRRSAAEPGEGVKAKRAAEPERATRTAGGGGVTVEGAHGPSPANAPAELEKADRGGRAMGGKGVTWPMPGYPGEALPPRAPEHGKPAAVTKVTPRVRLVKMGGKLGVALQVEAPDPSEALQVEVGGRQPRRGAVHTGETVLLAKEGEDSRPRSVPVTITYGGTAHTYTLYLPSLARLGQLQGDATRRRYRGTPLATVLRDISWRRGLVILAEGALDRKVDAEVILDSPRAAVQTVAKLANYEVQAEGYAYTLTPRPEK